jgi:flagellar secretion chaperone FliS
MKSKSHDVYLEQEVLSAAPQKLQLLLIETAIRQVNKTALLWEQSQDTEAGQAIVRTQEIMTQLLAGLDADRTKPLVNRVAAVYSFIIRSLAKAYLQRDQAALNDALRLLNIERETWQQVCQQLGNRKPTLSPVAPHFAHPGGIRHESAAGFSLEA